MISFEHIKSGKAKIALVGLGYVGLPLAAAFGKVTEVIGFDISEKKIAELKRGYDATGELSEADLRATRIARLWGLSSKAVRQSRERES